MVGTPVTTEQLFDLILLGMTWLRQEKPDELARPGSSICHALYCAGAIPRNQQRQAGRDLKLISLAMRHGEVLRVPRKPGKPFLRERIGNSDKYLLTLAVPGNAVLYPKFFGARGYEHVITEAGIEYALSRAGLYAQRIDLDRFMKGWAVFGSQMAAVARDKRRANTNDMVDATSGGAVTVPRILAPRSEKDFEW